MGTERDAGEMKGSGHAQGRRYKTDVKAEILEE